jgi:chaperone modulatory protein CbpM
MARESKATLAIRVTRTEILLSHADLARAAGITAARLTRLVQLGVVEPEPAHGRDFSAAAALRLRRMLRLERDLGVDLESAAIMLDLLERLEHATRRR